MKPQVISFHCVLKNSTGKLISTTFSRDVFTQAPAGEEVDLPALALRLRDLHSGEHRKISLDAADAYGFYDPQLVLSIARDKVPNGRQLRMGDQIRLEGDGQRLYRVVEEQFSQITLDANHPLAGQDLVFDIDVVDAREATADELRDNCSSNYLH